MNARPLLLALASAISTLLPLSAAAGPDKRVAYHYEPLIAHYALLIDWLPGKRAHVVTGGGAAVGSVSASGTQRQIDFDAPITVMRQTTNRCNEQIQVRDDQTALVVRNTGPRTSHVVDIGTRTEVGGCDNGLVTPYGLPTDEGSPLRRTAMDARPPMSDVVPGARLGGMSSTPWTDEYFPPQDIGALAAGSVHFEESGQSFPANVDANGWLMVDFGSQVLGYTRLDVDRQTGAENWLVAEMAGGQPTRVREYVLTLVQPGASFATGRGPAREWRSLTFDGPYSYIRYHLYGSGDGERFTRYEGEDEWYAEPISSWQLAADDLALKFQRSGYHLRREWKALRNDGRSRWVMERVWRVPDVGAPTIAIQPRVVGLRDEGAGSPGHPPAVAGAGRGSPPRAAVVLPR